MPTVIDVSLALNEITPYENNSRLHSDHQIKTLGQMIKRFGFTQPILVDEDNVIIAGYGRYQAAKAIQYDPVPCRRVKGISDSEKRALVIADNKIQEQSTWDYDKLLSETQSLVSLDFGEDLNKLLNLTSSADPGYKPILEPVQGAGLGVTDESVQRQQEKLANQFSSQEAQNLAEITCPYCDESFTVDASILQ